MGAGKVLKNEYIYSVLTKVLTFIIGILQSVLIARYLGAELKGINAYINRPSSMNILKDSTKATFATTKNSTY